jgi:hypothetical protein
MTDHALALLDTLTDRLRVDLFPGLKRVQIGWHSDDDDALGVYYRVHNLISYRRDIEMPAAQLDGASLRARIGACGHGQRDDQSRPAVGRSNAIARRRADAMGRHHRHAGPQRSTMSLAECARMVTKAKAAGGFPPAASVLALTGLAIPRPAATCHAVTWLARPSPNRRMLP